MACLVLQLQHSKAACQLRRAKLGSNADHQRIAVMTAAFVLASLSLQPENTRRAGRMCTLCGSSCVRQSREPM